MASNFAEAFLQGQAIGTQQRKEREASHLERLMGQAYTADPANRGAALQEVGLRSPRAAMELEGAFGQQEDRRRTGLQHRAKLILSVPQQMRPQLLRRMVPDIVKSYPELAELANMQYDPATFDPVLQQLASDKSSGTPAQVQVFEAQARAAGLTPGSPEYQKAAQIALGLQGRASSAGMSFDTVDDNGVPRPQRRDPRSGQVELYVAEQGAWVPLGGGQSAPQSQPMPQGAPQPSGNGDPKADSIMTAANAMVQAGVPQPQVEAFIQQSMAAAGLNPQPGGTEPPQMVPAGGGQSAPAAPTLDRVPINNYGGGAISPTFGRGRTKEEEAAAVEAAKLRTNLQFAPDQAAADAARAGAIKTAEAVAERTEAQRGMNRAYDLYRTASQGLEAALAGTTTNPAVGNLPAWTGPAQTAEGAIAAMAPVLKQLFRQAGEGVFTDKDQELLMRMLPTRQDHPEARRAKLANIDSIVQSKLGIGADQGQAPAPQPSQRAPARGQYQPGQVIEANGKRYRVIGGDPNDPDVEEI